MRQVAEQAGTMAKSKTERPTARERLDKIDQKIIDAMIYNARISNAALAKLVGLSESATLERVRRLEKTGAILGYSTRVAPRCLGHNVSALVTIRLKSQSHDHIEDFHKAIRNESRVLSCFAVMGSCDYVAHVAAADVPSLERFLTENLLRLKAVERTESMFVLKYLKRFSEPVPDED
ncbi:MAG: Lrp/AsnC family transcriptional regulator [Planctomycetota bacterium]